MQLINHTPFPALLTRFGASMDVMGSSLVVRATYDVRGDQLVPSAEQSWPTSPKPWECAYGPMEADEAFYKGGTDLFVFGTARTPGRRPVSYLDVSFQVGKFVRDLVVFGLRAWLPNGRSLMASAPQRFVEMPLTMEHAFGGTAEWDELQVPCSDNPKGKGFYLEQEQAVGKQLPNVEDPRRVIARWDDRPLPVGVGICPPAFSERLKLGVTFDEKGVMRKVHGRLFNAAYPDMVAEGVEPGDRVRLRGVSHEGDLGFVLPSIPAALRVKLDRTEIVNLPRIDQIGIEVDQRKVFITYRHPFRYVLYAQQQRSAELLSTPVGG